MVLLVEWLFLASFFSVSWSWLQLLGRLQGGHTNFQSYLLVNYFYGIQTDLHSSPKKCCPVQCALLKVMTVFRFHNFLLMPFALNLD